MNLHPIGNNVHVRLDEADGKSKGGILIPDTAQKRPTRGTVLAVGTGKVLENGVICPCAVQLGDSVIFSNYGSSEVPDTDGKEVIVSEDEILGVVE